MDKFSNSDMSKSIEKPKESRKVINSNVKIKKKSAASQAAKGIFNYLTHDVLIPAAKKTFEDMVINGTRMGLYGQDAARRKASDSRTERISYRAYYDRDVRDVRENRTSRARSTYEYDDIVYPTRADAESVLRAMDESIKEYGFVSVWDLYDFAGETGTHTDTKYGWTTLRSASVESCRDGYYIRLPKAFPFD